MTAMDASAERVVTKDDLHLLIQWLLGLTALALVLVSGAFVAGAFVLHNTTPHSGGAAVCFVAAAASAAAAFVAAAARESPRLQSGGQDG